MTAVDMTLALPSVGQARTLAQALMAEGLNVDIRPSVWTGAARPVALAISGETEADVELVLMPLRDETDYEIVRTTE